MISSEQVRLEHKQKVTSPVYMEKDPKHPELTGIGYPPPNLSPGLSCSRCDQSYVYTDFLNVDMCIRLGIAQLTVLGSGDRLHFCGRGSSTWHLL